MTRYEAIFRRKSVRRYRDDEIDGRILDKIEHFGQDEHIVLPNLKIKWKVWKACDNNIKGLFLVKAPYYVTLYSETCENYLHLINAGCLMEQLALYLHTKGIGSCYQGVAKLRYDDEKELRMVMVMAFGRPAEPLERNRESFKRIELKKLVKVHGSFGKVQRKLLEPARLAPSAMNLQPWRFVVTENQIHLFVGKWGKEVNHLQRDWKLFDAGIALSHMLITAEELWLNVEYRKLDSISEKDFQNFFYVGSLLILDETERVSE